MEAAGPAPVTPDASATPAPAPEEGQPAAGSLLSRVGSLLKQRRGQAGGWRPGQAGG